MNSSTRFLSVSAALVVVLCIVSVNSELIHDGVTIKVLCLGMQNEEPLADNIEPFIAPFNQLTGATVIVERIARSVLAETVRTELLSGSPTVDAYIIPPQWLIDYADCLDCPSRVYLRDLTDSVRSDASLNWLDISSFFREYSSSYNGKVYAMPLDGDVQFVHYRADILSAYGLQPPTTWTQYLQVAQSLNGIVYDGVPIYGSCISKMDNHVLYYIAWSFAAPFLQSKGTKQGAFFDTMTMEPLVDNDAFAEAMSILKETGLYGPPSELTDSLAVTRQMFAEDGRCAMTIDWGDIPVQANATALRGKIGTAMLPGSTYVYDRDTRQFLNCTSDLCPYAIDGVNHAPYAASGGWSGVIGVNIPESRGAAAYDFLAYIESPDQSNINVKRGRGFDAHRLSQLTVEFWTSAGFSAEQAQLFVHSFKDSMNHANAALDMRVHRNDRYQVEVLNPLLHRYLSSNITIRQYLSDGWEAITEDMGRDNQLDAYRFTLKLPPLARTQDDAPLAWYEEHAWLMVTVGASVLVFIIILLSVGILNKKSRRLTYVPFDEISLGDAIGSGAFATVFKGEWRGSVIAAKQLKHVSTASMKRFKEEAALLADLRHPNIVLFMAFSDCDGRYPVLIMEYCEFRSVADVIHVQHTSLSKSQRIKMCLDAARGLMYLHSSKPPILHRDFKTANLLVTSDFSVKVSDFGLSLTDDKARHESDSPSPSVRSGNASNMVQNVYSTANHSSDKVIHVRGTPAYTAPELYTGEPATSASDVYAFGIVMNEIMSGSQPFGEVDAHDLVRLLINGSIKPTLYYDLDAQMSQLIEKCWDKNPRNRPTVASIVPLLENMYKDYKAKDDIEHRNHERSQEALERVFPKRVAELLVRGEQIPPQDFADVTVLFSDIVGFTEICGKSTPLEIAEMLHAMYQCFDDLSRTHGVFKVETIGDAYMVVGGLEPVCDNHVERTLNMAIAMQRAVESVPEIHAPDGSRLKIRIGIHCGPVVAQVIGDVRPRYCLFGDTVNVASRMESTGVAGKIQISQNVRDAIHTNTWISLRFMVTERGEMTIKGKGKMHTYWLLLPEADEYDNNTTADHSREPSLRDVTIKGLQEALDVLDRVSHQLSPRSSAHVKATRDYIISLHNSSHNALPGTVPLPSNSRPQSGVNMIRASPTLATIRDN